MSIIASPVFASSIVVPGTSDLWLAGTAAGTVASGLTPGSLGVDVAPLHAPVAVFLNVGQSYEFFASGCVSNDPTIFPCYGPDGGPWLGDPTVHHFALAENGIDDFNAPLNSLIGLWAGSSTPFFVGSHWSFVAPTSLLYLGTMDGWGWLNNWGAFLIEWDGGDNREIPETPEPATLMLIGAGLFALARMRRRT